MDFYIRCLSEPFWSFSLEHVTVNQLSGQNVCYSVDYFLRKNPCLNLQLFPWFVYLRIKFEF